MTTATDHNRRRWSRPAAVRAYHGREGLFRAEEVILGMLGEEFRNRKILDVGVGAGRTTPHLLQISDQYVGIDYSSAMIESCKSRYPAVDFRVCDAKNLSEFLNDSFDLIVFSYNGIDCMPHEDRLIIVRDPSCLFRRRCFCVFCT